MTQNLEHSLDLKLAAAWPPDVWRDSHVLLAVSGGPDSVAMLRGVLAWKQFISGRGDVHVGHFNHRRRPGADADQAWLECLCRQLDVPLEMGTGDVSGLAAQQGDGWEAAARSARYEFLRGTAEKLGVRFVVVAHTADDQVETVLHHLIRGTGLAGLAGMPFVRPLSPSVTLVRPLLKVRRREVLEYLSAIGQDFRTDATNADLQFMRNRLRHELLPALRKYYSADVDDALVRIASQACESQQLISALANNLADQYVSVKFSARCSDEESSERELNSWTPPAATCVRIDCRALFDQPRLLVREVCKLAWSRANWPLQAMGFNEWQQLADRVLSKENLSPASLPGNIRVRHEVNYLIFEARD